MSREMQKIRELALQARKVDQAEAKKIEQKLTKSWFGLGKKS